MYRNCIVLLLPNHVLLTDCGIKGPSTHIVGGTAAVQFEFPWMVGLLSSDGGFYGCAASLLSCSPVIIVSAAHCFQNG